MKIHGKMGFADFQEDDIQLPGFYTNIPPSNQPPPPQRSSSAPRVSSAFSGCTVKQLGGLKDECELIKKNVVAFWVLPTSL